MATPPDGYWQGIPSLGMPAVQDETLTSTLSKLEKAHPKVLDM